MVFDDGGDDEKKEVFVIDARERGRGREQSLGRRDGVVKYKVE